MSKLESEVLRQRGLPKGARGQYNDYPTKATCVKTGTLTASCVLTYDEVASLGEGKQERFNEAVTIAADGHTYEYTGPTAQAAEG